MEEAEAVRCKSYPRGAYISTTGLLDRLRASKGTVSGVRIRKHRMRNKSLIIAITQIQSRTGCTKQNWNFVISACEPSSRRKGDLRIADQVQSTDTQGTWTTPRNVGSAQQPGGSEGESTRKEGCEPSRLSMAVAWNPQY